jgi:hypothetical protein
MERAEKLSGVASSHAKISSLDRDCAETISAMRKFRECGTPI